MDVFSLLKYWRSGGLSGSSTTVSVSTDAKVRTTDSTNVRQTSLETDEPEDEDEGSFFDLKFALPDDDDEEEEEEEEVHCNEEIDSEDDVQEREFNFTNLSISPSDDLFFKSKLGFNTSEPNSKSQFPGSFIKSAIKFRVFKFGLKKPKSTANTEINAQKQQQKQHSKFFTVKFKVEEVPIVSLFTRDNSSRISGTKIEKQSSDEVSLEEKKFAKDVLQKYLKMIKPLYVRVSKRYGEKLKFSSSAVSSTPLSSPTKIEVDSKVVTEGIVSNFKNLKQLGKSRSASSAVSGVTTVPIQSKRRDDSLLQQQDGIQSAILHCKRSFNASKESDSSLLTRSTSDPSHEKLIDSSIHSSESEAKDAARI